MYLSSRVYNRASNQQSEHMLWMCLLPGDLLGHVYARWELYSIAMLSSGDKYVVCMV